MDPKVAIPTIFCHDFLNVKTCHNFFPKTPNHIAPSLFLALFYIFLAQLLSFAAHIETCKIFSSVKLEFDNHNGGFSQYMVWGIFGKLSIPTFQETPQHSPHHGHHYQSSFTRWEAGQWGGRTRPNRWPQIHPQKHFKCPEEYFFKVCQHLKYQEK